MREGTTAQTSQPSELPLERSADPGTSVYYQDTRSRPSEALWTCVMNELRPVQFACEQLRTRMESVEVGADLGEIRENQDVLSCRISRAEESVSLGDGKT